MYYNLVKICEISPSFVNTSCFLTHILRQERGKNMKEIGVLVPYSPILKIVLVAMIADIVFDVLSAFKEGKMNSSLGVTGLIRKVGMIMSMIFLCVVDKIVKFNLIGFLPQDWLDIVGIGYIVGLAEFFGIVFILYEAVSILKNMVLIGVPIPRVIRDKIEKFLYTMTDEMPKDD